MSGKNCSFLYRNVVIFFFFGKYLKNRLSFSTCLPPTVDPDPESSDKVDLDHEASHKADPDHEASHKTDPDHEASHKVDPDYEVFP